MSTQQLSELRQPGTLATCSDPNRGIDVRFRGGIYIGPIEIALELLNLRGVATRYLEDPHFGQTTIDEDLLPDDFMERLLRKPPCVVEDGKVFIHTDGFSLEQVGNQFRITAERWRIASLILSAQARSAQH